MVGLEREAIDRLFAEPGGGVFEQGTDAFRRFLGSFGEQGVVAAGEGFDLGGFQPDRLDRGDERQPVELLAQDAFEAFAVGRQISELKM